MPDAPDRAAVPTRDPRASRRADPPRRIRPDRPPARRTAWAGHSPMPARRGFRRSPRTSRSAVSVERPRAAAHRSRPAADRRGGGLRGGPEEGRRRCAYRLRSRLRRHRLCHGGRCPHPSRRPARPRPPVEALPCRARRNVRPAASRSLGRGPAPGRAHLLVGPGCSLPPGRYAYDPHTHRAHPRGPAPDGVPAGALAVLTVAASRTVAHYGHRAWPLLLLDAGHAAAALAQAGPPTADVLVCLDADGALLSAAAGLPRARPGTANGGPGTRTALAAVWFTPSGGPVRTIDPLSAWATRARASAPVRAPGPPIAQPRELSRTQRLLSLLAQAPARPAVRGTRHPARKALTGRTLTTRRSAPPEDLRRPPERELLASVLTTARAASPAGPDWTVVTGGAAPALYTASPGRPGLLLHAHGDARPPSPTGPPVRRGSARRGRSSSRTAAPTTPRPRGPHQPSRRRIRDRPGPDPRDRPGLRSRPIGSWQQADLGAALVKRRTRLDRPRPGPRRTPGESDDTTRHPYSDTAHHPYGDSPCRPYRSPARHGPHTPPARKNAHDAPPRTPPRREHGTPPLGLATALLAAVTATHSPKPYSSPSCSPGSPKGHGGPRPPAHGRHRRRPGPRPPRPRPADDRLTAGPPYEYGSATRCCCGSGRSAPPPSRGHEPSRPGRLVDGVEGVDAYVSRYLPQALITCLVPPALLVAVALVARTRHSPSDSPCCWPCWGHEGGTGCSHGAARTTGTPTKRSPPTIWRPSRECRPCGPPVRWGAFGNGWSCGRPLCTGAPSPNCGSPSSTPVSPTWRSRAVRSRVLVACSSAATGATAATGTYLLLLLASECFRPVRDLSREWHAGYLGVSAADGIAALRTAEPPCRTGNRDGALDGPPEVRFENVRFTTRERSARLTASPSRPPRAHHRRRRPVRGRKVDPPQPAAPATRPGQRDRHRRRDRHRGLHPRLAAPGHRRGLAGGPTSSTPPSPRTCASPARPPPTGNCAPPPATRGSTTRSAAFRTATPRSSVNAVPRSPAGSVNGSPSRGRCSPTPRPGPGRGHQRGRRTRPGADRPRIVGGRRDRTRIVVAHRLDAVRHADHIVVLDAGRVAAEGDHATLLAGGGVYAALVAAGRTTRETDDPDPAHEATGRTPQEERAA